MPARHENKKFTQEETSPNFNPFRKWQRTIFFSEEKMIVSKILSRDLVQEDSWSYRGRFLLLNFVMCPICALFAWIRTNQPKSLPGPPVAVMHFTRIVSPNIWPRKWSEARLRALRVDRNSVICQRSHWCPRRHREATIIVPCQSRQKQGNLPFESEDEARSRGNMNLTRMTARFGIPYTILYNTTSFGLLGAAVTSFRHRVLPLEISHFSIGIIVSLWSWRLTFRY
jgi:hypothetical protein